MKKPEETKDLEKNTIQASKEGDSVFFNIIPKDEKSRLRSIGIITSIIGIIASIVTVTRLIFDLWKYFENR